MSHPIANIERRECWMGKEFGETFARRIFGDAIVDALPRNARGKSAGKFKTTIRWHKVTSGGWVRQGPGEGNGYVERRVGKIIHADIVVIPWGSHEAEVLHSWTYGMPRADGLYADAVTVPAEAAPAAKPSLLDLANEIIALTIQTEIKRG